MVLLESALNYNLEGVTFWLSWPLCEVSISAARRTKLADRSYYRSGILVLDTLSVMIESIGEADKKMVVWKWENTYMALATALLTLSMLEIETLNSGLD